MSDRIRAARAARGWSQQELADRAGVTRQLVGAVEAGRHLPSVAAALRLARALGEPVETLFAEPTGVDVVPLFDEPVQGGEPLRVAQVGDRYVAVAVPHGVEGGEQWAAADALVTGDGVGWLPGSSPAELLVAGCDPLLGLLAAQVRERTTHRVLAVTASTGRALAALDAGRVHGVVVHGPEGSLPGPSHPVRRWHLARWQVGLASNRRGGPPTVGELAERRAPVVQRDAGASSQQAFERALRAAGASTTRLPGPVAEGHLDAARRAAASNGLAGVTMEAAARSFRLGFVPLEVHTVEVWMLEEWAGLRAASALVDLLDDPAFRRRVDALGGYDLTDCGASR